MTPPKCGMCRNGAALPVDFTMAFQPIVDLAAGEVWAYEALVRGRAGQTAGAVLANITPDSIYAFDQACRTKAIALAGERMAPESRARLSINFLPRAVYEPRACIQATLKAAAAAQFDPARLIFEFTENERFYDVAHVERIIEEYHKLGFSIAIDDFGAGYSGLALLARFDPDIVKLDMGLVRGINESRRKQTIVSAIAAMARGLDIELLAEGVETREEAVCLRAAGVRLFQGRFFGAPALEQFKPVDFGSLDLPFGGASPLTTDRARRTNAS